MKSNCNSFHQYAWEGMLGAIYILTAEKHTQYTKHSMTENSWQEIISRESFKITNFTIRRFLINCVNERFLSVILLQSHSTILQI